jgi:hypothetical protein
MFALNGGHGEFIIGRAFARPVGFAHPTVLAKDGLLRRFAPCHDGDGAASHRAVIPRACGVSSTLRPLDSITDASEYWIARRSLSSGGHSADPLAGDDD